MRLIEALGPRGHLAPGEYPSPCVVEDDNGYRIFITPTTEVNRAFLGRARTLGARMTITETPRGVVIDDGPVVPCDGYPSYLEAMQLVEDSKPKYSTQFVHLHTHSEYSALDGLSTIQEIVERAVDDGNPAIAITDHGTSAGHPLLQQVAVDAGIKPIMGIEAYFVDDRLRRAKGLPSGYTKAKLQAEDPAAYAAYELDMEEASSYWHLILWAQNDVGLRNLWAMSTEANTTGFYNKPRMDWTTLERYNEGIMCSTACLNGPLSKAILADDEPLAVARLSRLQSIFPDRLYLELHTNQESDQFIVNAGLVGLGQRFSTPLIAVSDSHYSCLGHKDAHRVWIAAQTGKTLNEDSQLFQGDSDYHVMSQAEARKCLQYLPAPAVDEAIGNTVGVADRIEPVTLKFNPAPPVFSKQGGVISDRDRLMDLCVANWERKTFGKRESQEVYLARLEYELNMLIDKQFCGYFLMVADYCGWAKRQGILLGPGRGSGGGCLVAYLCGITEIDPVECELLFERFMTPGRTELPDFDVDFPSSRIEEVIEYIQEKYGIDSVVRIGTHLRLKNRGVIRKLAMVLKDTITIDFKDIDAMSKLIERAEASSAGLGISWDELMNTYPEEFANYRAKYPLLFEFADIFVGRLNTYGQHAAGVVISVDGTLVDKLPLRRGENGQLISEFDMIALMFLGLVKFDFLAVTTLDTLQGCVDLIKETTGEEIDLYSWREEYNDQEVWEYLGRGNTLGCFQIETPAGTKITKQVQPRSLQDLADVVTLDRPGPMRSGLDKSYFARRAGTESITYVDPRLEEVLGRSYGVMMYQEDIMKTCMVLAGYSSEMADKVRSILGKKKVELAKIEGPKFVAAAVEGGMDQRAAQALWDQMEEFSRYSFNRAHAYAYAMLGYWGAWLKFHYPLQFYVSIMSTVDQDRVGGFVTEAKRRGYRVVPPDINLSKGSFVIKDDAIIYGLESVKGLGAKTVQDIMAGQPYESFEDLLSRRVPKPDGKDRALVDMGVLKVLVRIGAFDSLHPNRRDLEEQIRRIESGDVERCVDYNPEKKGAPNDLPCNFDWDSEPKRLGARGKELKPKAPPKRCSKACRNYRKCALAPPVTEPYSDKEIRDIEMELLGVHLSSTPFDIYKDAIEQRMVLKYSDVEAEDYFTDYPVLGVCQSIKRKVDKNGKPFAIITLFAQDGNVDAICFASVWSDVKTKIHENDLVVCMMNKNDRGYTIWDALPA